MTKKPSGGLSRRDFIAGATASLAMTSAEASTRSRPAPEGRRRRVALFCDRGGLIDPKRPSDEKKVREFVETCVRHGVTTLLPWNGAELEKRVAHVAETIRGRCPLVAELSCYHPGSYQDPKVLLEKARRAKESGADSLGVYRAHAVDQLRLWPVVEAIAAL